MAEKKIKKKSGGGKLNRTQTVTLRLDPRLRYLTELAARTQRRTTSGFIEWAIERSLQEVILGSGSSESNEGNITLADESFALWDVEEADRFVVLAVNYPHLLPYEEQILWKIIRENEYVWETKNFVISNEEKKKVGPRKLILERLRDNWEIFKSVANGTEDKKLLPKITKKIARGK